MMSLFKTEFRRILFFSEETYELQFPKPISVHVEEEIQVDHEELLAQQQSLHVELAQLRQEQQILERERQQLVRSRTISNACSAADERDRVGTSAVSKEQQETAYEWTELLWDQSFQLAENCESSSRCSIA